MYGAIHGWVQVLSIQVFISEVDNHEFMNNHKLDNGIEVAPIAPPSTFKMTPVHHADA